MNNKNLNNSVLVVAAHPDDEILGVGGTILKHVKTGDRVSILVLGDGESSRPGAALADIKKREAQIKKAARALGALNIFIEKFPDNKFDSLSLLEIVKVIEKVINKVKPRVVYTHHAYDLNIDHCLTSQAVLTACRPQPNFCVKKILAFETLSSTEWQLKDQSNTFCPTEYIDISSYIEKKIEIFKIYKGEVKKYPHPRSLMGVKILAQYRGMGVGYRYAEAFTVIRILG